MTAHSRKAFAVVLSLLALVGCSSGSSDAGGSTDPSAVVERDEWAEVFDEFGIEGTFVLQRLGADVSVHNRARAETSVIPASTFKILNSLIALETGVIDDVDTTIVWDGVDRGVDRWNQDQTLRSAIEVSAVWAYQELARGVGEERMAEYVAASSYGNTDIGGPIDAFWLRGDLRISPLEQVDVLSALLRDQLPFEPQHQAAVREILVRQSGDDWVFAHKTGTALGAEPVLGWLVGYTEHDGQRWVFALNLDLSSDTSLGGQIDPQVRQNLARRVLVAEGALPQDVLLDG